MSVSTPLLARVTTYYERYLWEVGEAAGARDYLLGRGLSEEMLREFRVGYAPDSWDRIVTGLTAGRVQRR